MLTKQDENNPFDPKVELEDEIVVSGISGRFPMSDNFDEFKENLYNGVCMVNYDHSRYPAGCFGLPKYQGKLKYLSKFDFEFFQIPEERANFMDHQLRILLEVVCECIIDAGIDPASFRGSNTGFYYGSFFHEADMALGTDVLKTPSYKNIYTTQIPYFFDLKGPVFHCDTACAASFCALHEAYMAIKNGLTDQILVGGFNVCLYGMISLQFADLKMISKSGVSRCLDKAADGFSRSEAIVAVLLQRRKHAKRIYGTIINSCSNTDGYKIQGINFPSVVTQSKLMRENYSKANIDPTKIDYIEAHTTGTQAGDPVEMKAVYDVFCKDRDKSKALLVGCLKSNMGHAEATSGLCALTKATMIFQTLKIPKNLNYNEINPNIEGLVNGTMKAVTEITDFKDEVIPINCFGFGGSNVHMILRIHHKRLNSDSYKIASPLPRLVIGCGRNKDALEYLFSKLSTNPEYLTKDFLTILNNAATYDLMKNRGYMIIHQTKNGLKCDKIFSYTQTEPKKLYIIFNGFENGVSQHVKQIVNQMMNVNGFSNTIDRLSQHLNEYAPNQINLKEIMLQGHQNNVFKSILCLISLQIGLVNVLRDLELNPDGFIGLGLGEFVAAYANRDLNEKETILYSYLTAKYLSNEKESNKFIAFVDIEKNQNAKEDLESFVKTSGFETLSELKLAYIFSGEFKSLNKLDRHCKSNSFNVKYLTNNNLCIYRSLPNNAQLDQLIKSMDLVKTMTFDSNLLSGKWLRTCDFTSKSFKHLSQYLVHSITSKFMLKNFFESFQKNSTVVTVGPSQIFNMLLSKKLNSNLDCIDFFNNNSDLDQIDQFLHTIGHLYTHRWNPKIDRLYPVSYPVAIDTPNLSSLVQWDHTKVLKVFKCPDYFNPLEINTYFNFHCDLNTSEDWYLSDHCIDGRILFPATGYIMLAWAALCNYWKYTPYQISVRFRNVSILRATVLSNNDIKFVVQYLANTGKYIILQGDSRVSMGEIYVCDQDEINAYDKKEKDNVIETPIEEVLTKDAIYKELRIRGYDYGDSFQNLVEADINGTQGKVAWREMTSNLQESSIYKKIYSQNYKFFRNWVAFTDSMLQLALVHNKFARDLFVPVKINTLYCNGSHLLHSINKAKEEAKFKEIAEKEKQEEKKEKKTIKKTDKAKAKEKNEENVALLNVYYNPTTQIVSSKGLLVEGLKVSMIPRRPVFPILENYKFFPYFEDYAIDSFYAKEIEAYAKQCLSLKCKLENIKDTSDLTDEESSFDFDPTIEKYALLTELKKKLKLIKTEESDNKKTSAPPNFDNDLLLGNGFQFMFSDYFSRPLLENSVSYAVYSGSSTINVKIGEVNTTSYTLTNFFKRLFEVITVHSSQLDYTLFHSHLSTIKDQVDSSIKKRNYNLDDSTFSSDLNELDVIIARLDENKDINLKKFFASAVKGLKPKGTVVFFTRIFIFAKEFQSFLSANGTPLEMKNYFYPDQIIEAAEEAGFVLVSKRIIHKDYLPVYGLLFVLKSNSNDEFSVVKITVDDQYEWLDFLKEKLKPGSNKKIWLVSEEPDVNGVMGFAKCLGFEPEGQRIRVLTMTPGTKLNKIDFNKSPFKEVIEKDMKMNVYDDKLGWGSYVHIQNINKESIQYVKKTCKYAYVKSLIPGDLTSLNWVKDDNFEKTIKTGSLVDVYYAPLNFKDILHATGRLPFDAHLGGYASVVTSQSLLGLEFAGKDKNGNRVMGMIPYKGLATQIVVNDRDFLWPVPSHWTLKEASTIPVVYSTAYYALIVRGKLVENESILIHCGSGGVGFAAITICLHMNCKVYTTVSTQEKRNFVKKHFPMIQDEDIFNSRNTSFEEKVLNATDGVGVDVVLNSLSEEKLQASLKCLAKNGRFLEIGKFDSVVDNSLSLLDLDNNKTYEAVMLDNLYVYDANTKIKASVAADRKRIGKLLTQGILNGVVKPLPITLFQKNQIEEAFRYMATGKHMGKVVIQVKKEKAKENKIVAVQTINFDPDKYYLLIGAFSGVGLEMAFWFIQKGARHLVLNSRNGPRDSYDRFALQRMKDLGVNVIVSQDNLIDYKNAKELIEKIESIGTLGGVFNCALILHDANFKDQTKEFFKKVCEPKTKITMHMDKLTREKCKNLDYFLVMSSIVTGRGNPGQSNYAYANGVMESICETRRKEGLPGISIQWGFIGDVGYVVKQFGNIIAIRGSAPQPIYSVLQTMEKILATDFVITSSFVLTTKKNKFSAETGDIMKIISHILGIKDMFSVDPNLTLSEIGMDSLMAVEIQQALDREYSISMSTKEIRSLKVSKLVEFSTSLKELSKGKERGLDDTDFKINFETLSLPKEPVTFINKVSSGKPIFCFPPVGGNYNNILKIVENFDRPAIGINWTSDLLVYKNNFDAIACYFVNKMTKYDKDNFDIIGYSFGGFVGVQIDHYLTTTKKGKVKNLILLDSDTDEIKAGANSMLKKGIYGENINEISQQFLTASIIRALSLSNYEKVEKQLSDIEDGQKKLEKGKQFMRENGASEELIEDTINECFVTLQKFKLALEFNLNCYSDKNVLHCKANDILPQMMVEGKTKLIQHNVYYMNGNHHNFIEKNLSKIIDLVKAKLCEE